MREHATARSRIGAVHIGLLAWATLGLGLSFAAAAEPYGSDAATGLLLHLDGRARDASARAARCTLRGGRWTDAGVIGKALICDGKQLISAAAPRGLADGFTIEAWVRLDRPAKLTAYHLVSWPGALDLWFEVGPQYPRRAYLSVTTETGRYTFRSRHVLPYDRWCHVAVVYDPAQPKDQPVFLFHGERKPWKKPRKASGRVATGKGRLKIAEGFAGAVDELRVSTKPRKAAELNCRWPSGRSGDFEPFRPDVTAPASPKGWDAGKLRLTAAQAVPTFNSIGLYVRYAHDSNANGACRVRYREKGSGKWRRGMDLVPERVDGEFRGSLFMLKANTAYEIELTPTDPDGTGAPLCLTKRTWPENVPIGETRRLPEGVSNKPLVISAQGKPDAWVLYAPPQGKTATIDVGQATQDAVRFDKAAYVILQGVTIRGGTRHAVYVMDSHHVRIRRCEMTGYGTVGKRGKDGRFVNEQGRLINMTGGVCVGMLTSRVVVEDNFIHTPRGSANSWSFGHPAGPQAVILGFGHNNVIRNNEMIGGQTHWWNDAIEGIANQWVCGGPYRDTDIHGNVITFANDNAVELDGGQINVRFWDNRMENIYRSISFSPCRKGPGYAFRNLVAHQGDEVGRAGTALKTNTAHPYKGLNIILHNTIVGPGGAGLKNRDYDGTERYHQRAFVRNDLAARPGAYADASRNPHGPAGKNAPAFRAPHAGDYRLAAGSYGIDAGIVLPGFNDDFAGKAPDMGAFEHGRDEGEDIPHRASGMRVFPRRVMLEGIAGQKQPTPGVAVALTIPESAGRIWRAIPNETWVQCTPASGRTSDAPLTVTIRCVPSSPEVRLHRAAVVFRTDLGLNCSMMVDLKLYHQQRFVERVEAESGTITGGMMKVRDETASAGHFVHRPIEEPSSPGKLVIRFEIPADGRYYISGRCLAPAPSGKHNSFLYAVDGETRRKWDVDAGPDGWSWDMLYQRADKKRNKKYQNPRVFDFSKGTHTLTLWSREPGTRLDRIAIANHPYPPE